MKPKSWRPASALTNAGLENSEHEGPHAAQVRCHGEEVKESLTQAEIMIATTVVLET